MNTKLKIESQIYTHSNDRFLSVHFNCDHNYYIGGICTDLALELTKASKELLKANNIFIKENGHSLLIGRKKKSIEGNEVFNSTLSSPLPIFIQLKVTNSRFWSVTDFNLLKASKNVFKLETPLIFQYEDKEEIMECSSKELTSEDQKKYDLRNFPKEIFGILILDLNKVSKNKMNLKLKLEAPEVKLKYKVIIPNGKTKKSNKTGKRLTIDDILGNKKVLRESSFKEENKLELTVKKIRDFYIVESVKKLVDATRESTPKF